MKDGKEKYSTILSVKLLFHFVCGRANENHEHNNPRQQISGGKSNKASCEQASEVL
jgi:hypothetical protein